MSLTPDTHLKDDLDTMTLLKVLHRFDYSSAQIAQALVHLDVDTKKVPGTRPSLRYRKEN